MKRCSSCKVDLPLDSFWSNASSKDGKQGYCKSCKGEVYRRWAKANPDKVKARMRAHRQAYKAKPKLERSLIEHQSRLKLVYGITLARYDAMLAEQSGVCAICGSPPKGERLCVDHDHSCCPGKKSCGRCIRGLLCRQCNFQLGTYEKVAADSRYLAYLESR